MAATTAEPVQRIEIVAERRWRHDASFRAQVVAESLVAGVRVQDVAQRHGICPSLVYRWRRATGAMTEVRAQAFLPVQVTEEIPASAPTARMTAQPGGSTSRAPGMIEIELAGGIRVRVEETVGLAALRRVLGVLRG